MTCEDCLHYGACDYWLRKEAKHLNSDEGFVCEYFADKSEWICLPRKDYTTAYYPLGYGDSARIIEEPIKGWCVMDNKLYVVDECRDFYEVGTEVFLSKDTAKRHLQR